MATTTILLTSARRPGATRSSSLRWREPTWPGLISDSSKSDPDKLQELTRKKAKVALDEGYIFGPEGAGFERVNLACPKELIVELMNRLAGAIK